MTNPTNPIRVLLVDDDVIYRKFLRHTLDVLGTTRVQEATDGREASRQLLASKVDMDLVVCDIFMPDMDGMEFLEFLVHHQYWGKLTIVSNADKLILDVARTFAVQSGLQLVGAFPKEAVTPALLGAILNFA
jgi:CheY-like chemotaxis protein